MQVFNELVFDEFIPSATSAAPVYTSAKFNSLLGSADQLTCQLIGDNLGASGTYSLTATLQQSSDGRNWVAKSGSTDAATSAYTLPVTTPQVAIGFDQGQTPTLGFARYAIYFSSSAASGHVKLWVTGRE